MHKFNPDKKSKLDSPLRRKVLPPKETLENFDLKQGDIFADIGCGTGYFSFPAAEIVASEGKVFAMDISNEMIEDVVKKQDEENITNIEVVKTEENDLVIPEETATYSFMSLVFHEIKYKKLFLTEIRRILKEDGKLLIIEWIKKDTGMGPKVEERLATEEIQESLKHHGFKIEKTEEISDTFVGILARKI